MAGHARYTALLDACVLYPVVIADALVRRFGIEVIHPDPFIIAQWDLAPIITMRAFKQMRVRQKRPHATADDFADKFDRNALPLTANRLREAAGLI